MNQQISTKSIARIAAIQTLYQFASSQDTLDINSVLLRIKEFYKDTILIKRVNSNLNQAVAIWMS